MSHEIQKLDKELGLRTDNLTTKRERLYYRKLTAELLDFLRKHQVHLKDLVSTDANATKAIPLQVLQQAANLLERVVKFARTKEFPVKVVEGTTPEGREITFDLQKELQEWREFYSKMGIDQINWPKQISLTEEQRAEMVRLIEECGFDKMIIIPEGLPEGEELDKLMTKDYPKKTYRSSSFKADGDFAELGDRGVKFHVILTKDVQNLENDQLFKETLGKSVDDLELAGGIFETHGVTGFSLAEYLVYQREYFDRTGQHLDAKGWTWLPRSWRPSSGRVPGGFLYDDQLRFYSNVAGHRFGFLGCRLVGRFEV